MIETEVRETEIQNNWLDQGAKTEFFTQQVPNPADISEKKWWQQILTMQLVVITYEME